MSLRCIVLSLAIVFVISLSKLSSGSDDFPRLLWQSFCFATALASEDVVVMGAGSMVLASLARKSASSFPLMLTCAGIHWSVHSFFFASIKDRRVLIFWTRFVFPFLLPFNLIFWYFSVIFWRQHHLLADYFFKFIFLCFFCLTFSFNGNYHIPLYLVTLILFLTSLKMSACLDFFFTSTLFKFPVT